MTDESKNAYIHVAENKFLNNIGPQNPITGDQMSYFWGNTLNFVEHKDKDNSCLGIEKAIFGLKSTENASKKHDLVKKLKEMVNYNDIT